MFDWTILKFQRTAANGAVERPIPVERPLAQVGHWKGPHHFGGTRLHALQPGPANALGTVFYLLLLWKVASLHCADLSWC